MNPLINIANCDFPVMSHNGHIVVTFDLIDTLHQRPKGTALLNFTLNLHKFMDGEDFFSVSPCDISNALLTESGYLGIIKNYDDDLTWQIQREMVNYYFNLPANKKLPEIDIPHGGKEQDDAVSNMNLEGTMSLMYAYAQKVNALQKMLSEQEYKVLFYDHVASANNTHSIQKIAKVMGIGEQRLFDFLRKEKFLMADNMPFQQYVDSKHFQVLLKNRVTNGVPVNYHQTVITGKGFQLIEQRFHRFLDFDLIDDAPDNKLKSRKIINPSRIEDMGLQTHGEIEINKSVIETTSDIAEKSAKIIESYPNSATPITAANNASIQDAISNNISSVPLEKSKLPSPLPDLIRQLKESSLKYKLK